jgi:hypothetical protein
LGVKETKSHFLSVPYQKGIEKKGVYDCTTQPNEYGALRRGYGQKKKKREERGLEENDCRYARNGVCGFAQGSVKEGQQQRRKLHTNEKQKQGRKGR